MTKRNETLQSMCRDYLRRLRHVGGRYGVDVDGLIELNRRNECVSTRDEVEMLARMVNDDRIERSDIPKVLGKSYRQCIEDNDFDRIKKFGRVGVYSKISVLLHKNKKS